jgi:di/tricarboxylate transporter
MGAAAQLGVNVDPFLMAVAVGASCAFLTPIGHQNNTLILGPAVSAFGDYWQLGVPLEVIVVAGQHASDPSCVATVEGITQHDNDGVVS